VTDPTADAIAKISLLDEPVRRALYRYVSGRSEPVGRDEAARAVSTTRENAAFHLDKLVAEGLLSTSYRRIGGKTGPGAGRPSKLYQRSALELQVAVPARRYELAAELFARALEAQPGKDPHASVAKAARILGVSLGEAARTRARTRAGRPARLQAAIEVLEENGFEPLEGPHGVIHLRNCPFDALAKAHRDLVCGMNVAFTRALLAGLGDSGLKATFEPQPGMCCVALRTR
jgi:predicted ArsR family transcriptional regulator